MAGAESDEALQRRRAPLRPPLGTRFVLTRALGRVWLLGVGFGIYTALIYRLRFHLDVNPGLPIEALLTFAVGLMLGARVSKAYDRWWEARTQWGKLVNVSRNLVIKLATFAGLSTQEKGELHTNTQGFCRALKNHLRGGAPLQVVPGFEGETDQPDHVPAYLSKRIYEQVRGLQTAGRLDAFEVLIVDSETRELLEVSGACERIKNSLMPPSFGAFVRFSIGLLLLSLPFELTDTIQLLAVPAVMLATFLLAGGESIAHHMELPFGLHSDGLDLEGYCDGIDCVTAELLDVESKIGAA
jgi:putative membrane protein